MNYRSWGIKKGVFRESWKVGVRVVRASRFVGFRYCRDLIHKSRDSEDPNDDNKRETFRAKGWTKRQSISLPEPPVPSDSPPDHPLATSPAPQNPTPTPTQPDSSPVLTSA